MIKISIIIPVYNVEKYLKQCLDSVISQSYKNLEIICINDCSTDNSLEILKDYASKDSRIKILCNEKNLKVGLTRNRGLEIATGDYIHFLDADDWMEENSYEILVNTLNSNKVDILQFNLQYRKNGIIEKYDSLNGLNPTETYNLSKNSNIIYTWSKYSWNKIYSLAFLKKTNILFNDFPCFEDSIFTLNCLLNAQEILFSNTILYNYRKGDTNALTANFDKYIDYAFKYFYESIELCKNLPQDIKYQILLWEFNNIYEICYDLYKEKKFNYNTFREMLKRIDYSMFESLRFGALAHSQDVIKYPEFVFVTKTIIRSFIKNKLFRLYNIVLNIKKMGKR